MTEVRDKIHAYNLDFMNKIVKALTALGMRKPSGIVTGPDAEVVATWTSAELYFELELDKEGELNCFVTSVGTAPETLEVLVSKQHALALCAEKFDYDFKQALTILRWFIEH